MKKTGLYLIVLLAGFCLTGCGAARHQIKTVDVSAVGDNTLVKLHRHINADGQDAPAGYAHPHSFSLPDMTKELDALTVRRFQWGEYGLGSKWAAAPLFNAADRQQLAPALVAAFEQATPADRVAFTLTGKTGAPTTGEMFIKDNRLIWLLNTIDGMDARGKDRYWLDDRQWTIEKKDGLHVIPNEKNGQIKVVRDMTVAVTPPVAQTTYQGTPQTPATPAPVNQGTLLPPSHPAPAVQQAPPTVQDPSFELENKLRLLKKWREQGLINQTDYDKEKAMILEKLRGQ